MSEMERKTVRPVILCGGSGTRLWPLSTKARPKQYLSLLSDKSMVELTRDRVSSPVEGIAFNGPLAVGSEQHRDHLVSLLDDAHIILEPFGRNSAPAIAAACLRSDPEDILLVMPADHSIANVSAFHAAISAGTKLAENGSIVTFGIQPTFPATGYGYIKAASKDAAESRVEAFVEKPDEETAKQYLAKGDYFWNAGIFMFKASAMLKELDTHEPDIVPGVKAALVNDGERTSQLDGAAFARVPDISIDYAVLERAKDVMVVPVDMEWNDVGGYEALHDLLAGDETGNVTEGPVFLDGGQGNYLRSEGPRILVSGVKDLAVVATDEAVMIAPKGDAKAVKMLGQTYLSNTDTLTVPARVREAATRFLKQSYETWARTAWDETAGGFVEQLSMEGEPDRAADRRLRVQARQVYSFSKGASEGWVDETIARTMAERGLDYLFSNGRHPDGGWVHRLSPSGEVIDGTRDFYDHAFVILGAAACYKAFGIEAARDMGLETLQFLNEQMFDETHGGWVDALPKPEYRRANPHMHLLEASMELAAATGHPEARAVADKVVALFEAKLFRAAEDELIEYFDTDWTPHGAPGHAEIEPGHHYEWATLLAFHQRLTGHDTLSWQRRLITRADKAGLDPRDGFAFNSVTALGRTCNARKRLWPQLEMLRARLIHPGLAPVGEVERLFDAINARYLDGMPAGTWLDEIDETGKNASRAIPASMLYHFATSFGMLAG